MPFLIDFCSILPPNLASKTFQNRSEIDAQIASLFACVFWSIFGRFLLPTWTLRTQFGTSGLVFSWFFRFCAEIDFGSDFNANLPPFSLPKSIKIASKIDPERHQNFDGFLHRFFIDFVSILGPKLAPSWPLKSHQSHPKCFPRRTWEPESAQTPSKPRF